MTSGISEPLYEYVLQDVDDSESLADLLKQKLSEKTVDEIQLAQHSRIKEFREKMKSMFDSGKIRKWRACLAQLNEVFSDVPR